MRSWDGGSLGSQAKAINDAGVIVGYASEPSPSRYEAGVAYAARWVRTTQGSWQVTRLGAPGGRALALNERGDVVGTRNGTALVWPATGNEVSLIGGGVAEGINTARVIVGGTTWNNDSRAIAWTPNAGSDPTTWSSHYLPPLPNGTLSHAFAISEGGVIVGSAASAAGRWQAVIWAPAANGEWSSPVALSGTEASLGQSGGFAINAGGDVGGYYSSCSGCSIHAYFWPAGGGSPTDLAMLNSPTSSGHARGIENGRRVVGFISVPLSSGVGLFLWAPGNAALTDLGTGEANDINNRSADYGQEVVGFSYGPKGSQAMVWRVP